MLSLMQRGAQVNIALTSLDAISSFANSAGDANAVMTFVLLMMDGTDRRVKATADPVRTVAPSIA